MFVAEVFIVEKSVTEMFYNPPIVPFEADPKYHGEHNFYIHGIHVIKVYIYLVLHLSFSTYIYS